LIFATLAGALMVSVALALSASTWTNASTRISAVGVEQRRPQFGRWSCKRQCLAWNELVRVSISGYVVRLTDGNTDIAVNLAFFNDSSALENFIIENLPAQLREAYR
jgi:hypothetical protein